MRSLEISYYYYTTALDTADQETNLCPLGATLLVDQAQFINMSFGFRISRPQNRGAIEL